MSTEPTTSPVTKLVPGITLVALVAMIAGAIFHVATLRQAPAPAFNRSMAPDAPVYTDKSSWFAKPLVQPAGGWEKPWGIDLFWINDKNPSYKGGWNAPTDWAGNQAEFNEDLIWIERVKSALPTYAPKIRTAANLSGTEFDTKSADALEQEDVLAAFDVYGNEFNLMRGLIIGGRGAGAKLAADLYSQRIQNAPSFENVFGIVVIADAEPSALDAFASMSACTDETTSFPCLFDITGLNTEERATQLTLLAQSLSIALDTNAPKPAAPLAPMEFIDIAPINKPDGQ